MINLIQQHLRELTSSKTLWVAYSGGLDSHVLLHSLSNYPANIQAIHVHHGLNPQADDWASHCQKVCDALQVPLVIKKIKLQTPDKNVEAMAREKRYAVFSQLLETDAALLMGHHQDDQAETLLLQLFRGAGPEGLSAMAEKIPFANGMLIRPLLHFTRETLREYAKLNQLTWIEDSSNQNLHFHRNFIRHELLPLIQTRWPSISKTLARSAQHMANTQALLDTSANEDLKNMLNQDQTLSLPQLIQLSSARQQNVLRYWLMQLKLPLPSREKLLAIQKNVLHCKPDASPVVQWADVEIRRYRNKIHAMKSKKISLKTNNYDWNLNQNLNIAHYPKPLTKADLIAQGIDLSGIEKLTVRFRQEGERCKMKGHLQSKSLKKIFQEQGIPPWERQYTPLIFEGDQLIAILKDLPSSLFAF